jgi:hypothetical protein
VAEFNWTDALDALGRGHDLDAVARVRKLAAAFGVEEPIPLHPAEQHRIDELRAAAARNLAQAAEIEAAGLQS